MSETKSVVENSIAIFRDLTLEVFNCKEEIKKRNGMFTDLLIPDIKLSIKNVEQYNAVDFALKKPKIVENLVS